ncbi:MAG: RidA family protein [Bauldia litoralis]
MDKQYLNPEGTLNSIPRGYSHAIKVSNPGSLLFLAGQGPVDENLGLVGGDDIEAQTRKTFQNIERLLTVAGASFGDIVKMIVFCSDIDNQQWPIRNVRAEFIDVDNPPVSTMIEVSKFAIPGMMIEIDCVVAVP